MRSLEKFEATGPWVPAFGGKTMVFRASEPRSRIFHRLEPGNDAAGHFGLSERGRIRLRGSIDLGELERYHAADCYDQPGRVGHRDAALRCGVSPAVAGSRAARPCPRSPWVARHRQ